MILVGASVLAAALPFSVINASGVPVAGYAFANVGGGITNEFQIRLPGGTYANTTIARIFDLGNGDYEYRLTAGETVTAGKVYYRTVITGYENYARWEDIIAFTSGGATAADVWNYVLENGKTAQSFMRLMKAVTYGRAIYGLTSRVFRDDADTKARLTATVDASGRYGITEDPT